MHVDKYGQQVYSEKDLLDLYLSNPELKLTKVITNKPIKIDPNLELEDMPMFIEHVVSSKSIEEFDKENREIWFIPEEYKTFDIAQFVLDQCQNEAELQRAGEELLLYQDREMFMLLRYLKYLVDIMRKNNIVWGVGRGSSVSSFVLFLIGVHRINSLYYDLPITEFLK